MSAILHNLLTSALYAFRKPAEVMLQQMCKYAYITQLAICFLYQQICFVCSDDPIPDWPRALQPIEADTKGQGKMNESVQVKDEVIDDMDIDKQVSFVAYRILQSGLDLS